MKMRSMLTENVANLVGGNKQVALSFSGGTDSTCILFSCIDLGIKPVIYTYTLQGQENEDLKRAKQLAHHFNLSLKIGSIPTDINTLIADTRKIIKDGIKGKVCIQCMHGHYYIAPLVKEPVILNGSGIDGIYGTYKTFAFDGSKKDKKLFDKARVKHLQKVNDDAIRDQSILFRKYGVKILYPYRQKNIIQFLMNMSWDQINKPRLKWVIVQDYKKEYDKFKGYYRPRGSQQIICGTRELHDKLLRSPVNKTERNRVIELYKDIERGLI